MMALKENKLEHFCRIIRAFGCTNYMEVVEDIEHVAFGIIIHYKREYGFENFFLSRTAKANNDAHFIKFCEKVFSSEVRRGHINIINRSGLPHALKMRT